MNDEDKLLWVVSLLIAFVVGMYYGMNKAIDDLNMPLHCDTKRNGDMICVFPWIDPDGTGHVVSGGKYND